MGVSVAVSPIASPQLGRRQKEHALLEQARAQAPGSGGGGAAAAAAVAEGQRRLAAELAALDRARELAAAQRLERQRALLFERSQLDGGAADDTGYSTAVAPEKSR